MEIIKTTDNKTTIKYGKEYITYYTNVQSPEGDHLGFKSDNEGNQIGGTLYRVWVKEDGEHEIKKV